MANPLRATDDRPAPQGHEPAVVLEVRLAGPNGERSRAIGVGSTVEEALRWARESSPQGVPWLVTHWTELFAD